jgi:hypothetical protein
MKKNLHKIVFMDYLYENPERENSNIKGAFKPLLDRIMTDDLIKSAYLNDNNPSSPLEYFKWS